MTDNSVPPGAIPVDQFVPDSPQETPPPGAIPVDQFVPDGAIPVDQFVSDHAKYGTPEQEAITAAEGAASASTFGLSTAVETNPDLLQHLHGPFGRLVGAAEMVAKQHGLITPVKPEDIAGRSRENPGYRAIGELGGLGAGMLTGGTEAEALSAAGKFGVEQVGKLIPSLVAENPGFIAKMGSAAIKGGIENGLFQGGDEISKAFSGQGDQQAPVTAILTAGTLGMILGGGLSALGSTAEAGINKVFPNANDKTISFLHGVGLGQIISHIRSAPEQVPEVWDALGFPIHESIPVEGLKSSLAKLPPEDVEKAVEKAVAQAKTEFMARPSNANLSPSQVKAGLKFYDGMAGSAVTAVAGGVGAVLGGTAGTIIGGPIGGIAGGGAGAFALNKILNPLLESWVNKPISWTARKYTLSMATKLLSAGKVTGASQLLDYLTTVGKSQQAMTSNLEKLLRFGAQRNEDWALSNEQERLRNREKLKKLIDNGWPTQQLDTPPPQPLPPPKEMMAMGGRTVTAYDQGLPCLNPNCNSHGRPHPNCMCYGYAKGGSVCAQKLPHDPSCQYYDDGGDVALPDVSELIQPAGSEPAARLSPLEETYPAQATLLNMAQGRVSSYLNSVKPLKPLPQFTYDKPLADKQAEHSYNQALDIANEPMIVMKHIKDGTLTSQHMQHLVGMYPEVHANLSKHINDKLMEAKLKNEAPPPPKIRQGLSTFLGTPLDSTMTPASAQAIIASSNTAQPQSQPKGKGRASKSPTSAELKQIDKVTESYATPLQQRQLNRKA